MITSDPAIIGRVPQKIRFVVWSNPDGTYMGLAREVSVYATGKTLKEAASNLETAAWSYIADAVHSSNPADLLPRRISRLHWWKLLASLWLRDRTDWLRQLMSRGSRGEAGQRPVEFLYGSLMSDAAAS